MPSSPRSCGRAALTASIAALLGFVGSASAQTVFWDPAGDGNTAIGGAGTWNLTPLWDPTGTDALVDNVAWPNNDTAIGVFGGIGGIVTINTGTGVTANGLVFNVSGYTIGSAAAGDVLTMAGVAPSVTVTTATHSARINSIIAGTAGLNVLGAGTLVLGGANTYAGQTVVNTGATLSLGAAAALGATGVGNETVVTAGATLNVGGQAISNNPAPGAALEIIRIAGAGVDGAGAVINTGPSQNNALGKVVLTADATVGAGVGISTSYNAGGQIVTSPGGRFDIRLNAAPTAGQAHLDLAGFTLTKTGTHLFALVNADVTAGNIIVNEGQVNLEAGTLVPAGGNITVNPNGKLGFFSVTAAGNITRQIIVNGGTVGDPTSTGAVQTINAPIQFTGALNPNFAAISTNRTTLAGVISQTAFTGTGLDKRGPGTLTFNNSANSFTTPITIHAGILGGDFTTTLNGGVPSTPAVTSTDTPLGSNSTILLAGGTLAIRANMENSASQQVFDLQRSIVLDRAPSGMTFDRIGNTTQTDKHVRVTSVTIAPASAANGFSIGQNQFSFVQGNTHRLEIPLLTMGNDTLLVSGDHTFSGNIVSTNRSSLGHGTNNTVQFISPGTHDFNAFFNLAGSIRVGSGFGTPITSDTVTVGTGTIHIGPGAGGSWRVSGNLAPGQAVDATASQQINIPGVNFSGVTAVPGNLRARGSGVYGVGGSTYGDIDLRNVGDGTWRIGAGIAGGGNGTITGKITGTKGNVVRAGGGGGTVTSTGTDAISGSAFLEVGAALLNNAATSFGTGTFVVTAANNFTGGTQVNRASTLGFEHIAALGTGPVTAFGTITAQGAGGTFTADGLSNAFTPVLLGGSTLSLNNGALTGNVDVNRWGDSVPVTLNASTLTFNSRNDNASLTTEQIGDLSVAGGSILNMNRQNAVSGNVAQLFVNSLVRVGTGTLEAVRTTGTGAGWGGGQLFRVNGTVPSVENGMISPWVMQVNNGVIEFSTFGANGIVPAGYDATVTTGTYAAGSLDYNGATGGKVDVTTAALTLADDPILYALRTNQAINVSGTNDTITIRSGGLIGNATTGTTTIAPALVFNDGTLNREALVNSRSGGNLNITGTVTAAGFTKFGVGTVSLHAANPNLSGVISVNQGPLQLHGPTATGTHNVAGSAQIQLRGGQLNLRSNNSAVTGTINPTLQTGILVAAGLPTATIDLNRSGADTASSGTFIFNPAAAASPGLILQGSPGAQGQTLNLSGANYNLQFGTNAQNSFDGNITINNAVNLTLNNAPTYTGTTPTITKSGAGTWIVGAVAGSPSAAPNMQVVLNAGTLEMRSVLSFGPGGAAGAKLVLNGGILNLRRDSAGDYGGLTSATAYYVTINGNVTLSTDRNGGTATNYREGLGPITINGSPTLTVNNGNGIYPDIFGIDGGVSMRINGVALLASNVVPTGGGSLDASLRLRDAVVGGAIVKLGTGHLHLLSSGNTYDGGTYVNQGILRARAANVLGTGPVYLNPGATIDFNSSSNLAAGQPMFVRSSGAFLPMISVSVGGLIHPFVNTTNAPQGVVGLSNSTAGSYDEIVNLGAMYGGGWSFGGVAAGAYDPVYTGPSIVAGNDNLYRLGGGGTAFALGTDSARTARANVLTGANNVRLGFDSGNILPVNHTNFQYSIAGLNDYSGGSTVIHRGMHARLFSATDGIRSGFSNSAVDVFGVFSLSGLATLDKGDGHVNAVTFHPGSGLFLDNANAAANGVGEFAVGSVSNRWNDATPVTLNGAMINLIGSNNGPSSETVGDVTYSRGARLRAQLTGTGTATLTVNSLSSAGPGSTLTLQSSAPTTLGGTDQIVIANGAPTPVNGMVSPSIVNGTTITNNATSGQSFVTYGSTGFVNVTYDKTLNATYTPGSLLQTDKVDVGTAALALADNPVVYALRTSQSINFGGPFNQLSIRSGGLISHLGNVTINPNLVFNDGAQNVEARIFVGTTASATAAPAATTMSINGMITANGVTKFGAGNLSINVPQPNYASGWTVNSGTLQINDLQGLGQSVPGNTVTLNAAMSTGGLASQALAITNLTFTRNQGTPELQTFSGGPITVINEATIRVSAGDDRNLQIPAVTLDSTSTASSVSFTFDVPNNRFRATIPNLTLNDDATVRVFDSGATTDTGRITAGVVTQLTAQNKNLVKIGNRALELPGDNSATFTGGSITVSQGSVRVRHNGSLGSATSETTIERNAALEIDVPNFTPLASINQLPGSIERWNREDVRGTTYDLPSGVNLQLNTNLNAARSIGLNGGTIEGFLWTDQPLSGVQRTVGPAVTINLLADSSIGQNNIAQGQGYDAGELPVADTVVGAYLRIEGNITGNFNLTKTGLDTVTLASAGNTYGDTTIDFGVLRLGVDNALPNTRSLTTRLNGMLDLFGHNQVITGLGTPNAGLNPGGTGVGSSGRITNSAPTSNTLVVNAVADYTYNGVIEQNVALVKASSGSLTLGGANTYRGNTTIVSGTLILTGSISGTPSIDVQSGAILDVQAAAGGYTVGAEQTLKGNGTVLGPLVTINGTVAPGASPGTLTFTGLPSFNEGSTLALELNGDAAYDRVVAFGANLNGSVNLSISLGYSPAMNTQFLVLDNTSVIPIGGGGLFNWSGPEGLLLEGEEFNVGGTPFTITYLGGVDNNDVILTAVPEPVSGVMLLGGLAILAARRRRPANPA